MNGEEHATVRRGPGLSAAASLAKAAGVKVEVALRHLENNTAKVLIAGPVAERRANEKHIERIERLTELRVRDIYLRAREAGGPSA